MTLIQRLAKHVGRTLAIEANGFSSEAGLLQAVCKPFIKVTGQFFVPRACNQIVLFDSAVKPNLPHVSVRVDFEPFTISDAELVRIGLDFVELVDLGGPEPRHVLIPLKKTVSIEFTD
jgi:hypothetical protein